LTFILGTFCHHLLTRTARWKKGTTLVDVVKAIVKHLDEPDPDYAVNFGKNFLPLKFLHYFSCFVEIGKEYMDRRPEFNRKALEMVKKHLLPRD